MLNEIKNIGASGVLGAAAGALVTNPASGLVFGVVGRLVHEVTQPILKHLMNKVESQDIRTLLNFVHSIAVIVLTAAACTAMGLPISFSTALVLQICQFAFACIGKVVLNDVCGKWEKSRTVVNDLKLSSSLVTICS